MDWIQPTQTPNDIALLSSWCPCQGAKCQGAVIPGGCVPCTRAGIAAHFNIAVYTLARSFDGIYSKASEYSDACFVSRYFYVCVLCSAYLLELFRGRTVWPEDLHYQILWLELLLMAG